MKLRDTNLQVYDKNSYTYLPLCILPSFSANASRFFQRGFESVRAKIIPGNRVTCNLPVQLLFI